MLRRPRDGNPLLTEWAAILNSVILRREPEILGVVDDGTNWNVRYRAPFSCGWIQEHLQSSAVGEGGSTYDASNYTSTTLVDCRTERMQDVAVTIVAGVAYTLFLIPVQYDGAGTKILYDGVSAEDRMVMVSQAMTNAVFPGTIYVDHVLEYTAAHGVSIDSVLCKDGNLSVPVGGLIHRDATGAGAITISGGTSGISGANITLWGASHGSTANDILFAADSTNKLLYDHSASTWIFADGATIELDHINEATAAHGVVIDGVTLKDGGGSFSDDILFSGTNQRLLKHAVTDQSVVVTGGTTITTGGMAVFFGSTHATAANDILFRAANVERLRWDNSDDQWESTYPWNIGALTATTGSFIGAAYSTLTVRAVTDDAYIYLDSGYDDVSGEWSTIYFRGGSTPTNYWSVAKTDTHDFRIYDHVAAQQVFLIVGNGNMTLSPKGGTTNVTGALTATGALSATTGTFSGLILANLGLTVASGQTLTLTGATVAGAPTWSSNQAITLSTAAQPNITSLGTLIDLTVTNPIVGSITGNAATATALETARAINGVDFDGTAPITVTAAAGTLTGTELNSTVVTSSLTSVGALDSGSISSGFGNIDNGSSTLDTGVLTATKITSTAGRIVNTTRATTTYQILVTDHVVFGNTDGATWAATLPVGVEGQTLKIVNSGTSGNRLLVDPNGAELLLGTSTYFTLLDGETLEITYNATDGWY